VVPVYGFESPASKSLLNKPLQRCVSKYENKKPVDPSSSTAAGESRGSEGFSLLYWHYETRRSHQPIAAARSGEAKDDSDVDLFFDHEKGKLGLFELMDLKEYAGCILGRKTDIMTRDSLHKMLRQTIEATAVRAF
jgi:predicted nucleotidyltransferase